MTEKFIKVQKRTAEKLYNEGKKIYLLPSNTRLENAWFKPIEISIYDNHEIKEFNLRVNEFVYYNCNYELGRYTHFYIKEEA